MITYVLNLIKSKHLSNQERYTFSAIYIWRKYLRALTCKKTGAKIAKTDVDRS